MTTPSDQGPLPTSTLAAQRMTIAGLRADLPLAPHLDGHLRLGYSCYAATGTARPQGACTSGRYASASVQRTTDTFDLGLEAMRMDATYAPAILPYGTLENVWSPAYSWPGTWLKGTYQLVGNAMMRYQPGRASRDHAIYRGRHRNAHRVRRAAAAALVRRDERIPDRLCRRFLSSAAGCRRDARQRAAYSRRAHRAPANRRRRDRLHGYPARPPWIAGTSAGSGRRRQHRRHRNVVAKTGRAWSRRLGAGRNAMVGAFDAATTNVDLAERVVFGGLQWKQNANWSYGLQYRVYSVSGMPTALPGGAAVSPAYHGPQIMLEQRFRN